MQDQSRSLLTWRWFLPVACVYFVGLCSLGVALRHSLGFPLDDSWIHQVIARNLVQHHNLGFTPGVASSGSSSTLWSFILALGLVVFPVHSPVLFPLILNAILLIVSGALLWRMAVLDELPLLYAIALAMLPALSGNYVWLAFIGMEHVLFVTLSLAAISIWFRRDHAGPHSSLGSSVAAGIVLGALGMTRPEGLALSVLLFALYKWCGRSFADVVRAAATAVVFLIPSFLVNLKTSGSLLPLTLRGRRFLYFGTDKLHVGRSTVLELMRDTYAKAIEHNFFSTATLHRWPMIFVALAFYGCFVLLRRSPNRTAILVLWAVLHYASYCATLPVTGHGGRYQPFVLLLFPSLLAIAAVDLIGFGFRLVKSRGGAVLRPAQAVAVLAVAGLTAATLPRWSIALGQSIYEIDNCHLKMAEYLDEHYPPGTPMGVFDIGAIGYFSHIDLIDLGGLVDHNYLPYLLSGRVPQYLEEKDAHYIVLAHNGPEGDWDGTGPPTRLGDQLRFFNNPEVHLQEIYSVAIDYPTWYSSYMYTQHAYRYQTLYRVTYLKPDGTPRP